MVGKDIVEKNLERDIAMSREMSIALRLWSKMYQNLKPLCYSGDVKGVDTLQSTKMVKSLNLSSTIASEMARIVTFGLESKVEGNEMLNASYQKVIKNIRTYMEYASATGGIVFKPYVTGKEIKIDITQADSFYPMEYNRYGEITSAVFLDIKTVGDQVYTRTEQHECKGTTYTVTNRAFLNENPTLYQTLGRDIPLNSIEDWADITSDPVRIKHITKPLFSYLKVPFANTIDFNSPLGASVYARAVDDIKDADRLWSRILQEYEKSTIDSNLEDLFFGLSRILNQIELKCGLAYGTLDGSFRVERTKEEVQEDKQRVVQTITYMRTALETALRNLVYSMEVIGTLHCLPVGLNNEVTFRWQSNRD